MKLNFKGVIKHTKTDFVIVSKNGKEIPCHKFVLAGMSPVFDAMFGMKDSKEVSNGRVEIPDASEKALKAMVRFMYTKDEDDDIDDDDEDENKDEDENQDEDENKDDDEVDFRQEMLVLSNKYDLKDLAKYYLPEFIKKIDRDNCIEAYAFGIDQNYKKVKNTAFRIIVFNWDLLQAEESKLKTLLKFHPKEHKTLVNEIARYDYDSCQLKSDNSVSEDNSDDDTVW